MTWLPRFARVLLLANLCPSACATAPAPAAFTFTAEQLAEKGRADAFGEQVRLKGQRVTLTGVVLSRDLRNREKVTSVVT